jgi:hypothetical protein
MDKIQKKINKIHQRNNYANAVNNVDEIKRSPVSLLKDLQYPFLKPLKHRLDIQ